MVNLIAYSRRYGSDPELTVAGGGNTSMKENGVLHVKGSGAALGTITADGFVALDITKLLAITEKAYPADEEAREAAFLADTLAARLPGQKRRPSVETLLHALFPQRYVLHLHPNLVNGLTCAVYGQEAASRLFSGVPWVGEGRPGYSLAMTLKDVVQAGADTVLLQNHGVFFAAETPEELDRMLTDMLEKLKSAIRENYDPAFDVPPQLSMPLTPDQIVYCGLGPELNDSDAARKLWAGTLKIARYTASFGGQHPLSEDMIDFITHWEAENYRRKQI